MSTKPEDPTKGAQVGHPVETDVAKIEAAIWALARAAAQAGGRTVGSGHVTSDGLTPFALSIERPITTALMQAEANLLLHLQRVAGQQHAAEVNVRVNAALHEEFDRPRQKAAGGVQ